MDFTGKALPLTANDIEIISGYLGCQIAALHAIIIVETIGEGFGSDNRPIILFEPHIFYSELTVPSERQRASREGLAYPKWGTKPYPTTQKQRYIYLEQAIEINETAALSSCSWGIGQVLGLNYKICGFDTVNDFVNAMMYSTGSQLYAMARFIAADHLQVYLRNLAWAEFARRYNGPAYASNHYDTKLKSAYDRLPAAEKITPKIPTQGELLSILKN
ncbi:N-acetylmuramidase family protein [Microbulbifer sp. GL-2]|uniref:N-acetylmuramidase family protein n=1 Tax=Microbulbifer sp. GL-2 TaxID=2591606 RepID=UPI0011641C33|nr:N-acetylmuramidase family protein [Microbulbifer sp. GL-2]BBM02893.1 peptidoglycan-binding protein [Microbulbifer sp. GL-2]